MVADAIASFLAGEAPSLDQALDVAGQQGQRKPLTLALLAERDSLIRQAAAEFFPGQSARRQAVEIHRAIGRYAATSWPRDRSAVVCPDRLSGIQVFAWRILRIDDRMLSADRLRKVLASWGAS